MKNLYNILKSSDNPLETARQLVAPICKDKLNNHILNCNECDFMHSGKNVCHGNPDANILIIAGNATDSQEEQEYLESIIDNSSINKNDIFIIHSVNCICTRKSSNDIISRDPTLTEVNNCSYFIKYAIQFVRPRIIISMGATALNQFFPQYKFLDYIGKTLYYDGIKTIITYSVNDLFILNERMDPSKIEELVYQTIESFNEAQNYMNIIK